jgi:hypothetical protein
MTISDWHGWHDEYDTPGSTLARRLEIVQGLIGEALDRAPEGPISVISLCAGQGRDVIDVLAHHPRGGDVRARLVELDPRNASAARSLAARLPGVDVVTGDAALTSNYLGYVPADIVVACGVYGNLSDADIERTVDYCTRLCATGGTVIWTRGRWQPDLLPEICDWYEQRSFERLWVSDPSFPAGVAAHRFLGAPAPLEPDATMFTFIGHDPMTGPRRR